MVASPTTLPTLGDFLKELTPRIGQVPGTKAAGLMTAITEGHDSFLMDTIADANPYFTKVWPADRELDDPALVEAFVGLVTAAHKFDSRLQKTFDKLVPKKASEVVFWRRYFAHVHALLSRIMPTQGEAAFELMRKLPAARAAELRQFPAKEPLKTQGELRRGEIVELFEFLVSTMQSDAVIAALGDEAAAEVAAAGETGSLAMSLGNLCMHYQLEAMESRGIDRIFGSLSLQPPRLSARFTDPEGKDKPVFEGLSKFVNACQSAPQMAKQRLDQRPSDDPKQRRFEPAATLEERPQLGRARLHTLVMGIKQFVDEESTAVQLTEVCTAALAEKGGKQNQETLQTAQYKMMSQVSRWQREYFESQGIKQDDGMRAVWGIPEHFQPTPRSKKGSGGKDETAELLQAFGKLRLSIQTAISNGMVEATKPATKPIEERRFPPAKGELQTKGVLSREVVLAFTKQVVEVLQEEASIEQMADCDDVSDIGTLAVTWQRELLEQHGIQMDFGCRALGEVPTRFAEDAEVMASFKAFQEACKNCPALAQTRHRKRQEKIEERRFPPAKGELQTTGPLSREMILAFTKQVVEVLQEEASIEQMANCANAQEAGQLGVTWQRELLEHHGVEMDHGCEELGQTPVRFEGDMAVMKAFQAFFMECNQSVKRSEERRQKRLAAKPVSVS